VPRTTERQPSCWRFPGLRGPSRARNRRGCSRDRSASLRASASPASAGHRGLGTDEDVRETGAPAFVLALPRPPRAIEGSESTRRHARPERQPSCWRPPRAIEGSESTRRFTRPERQPSCWRFAGLRGPSRARNRRGGTRDRSASLRAGASPASAGHRGLGTDEDVRETGAPAFARALRIRPSDRLDGEPADNRLCAPARAPRERACWPLAPPPRPRSIGAFRLSAP
jgi:hypothetical protein